jgi:hypothetical protein
MIITLFLLYVTTSLWVLVDAKTIETKKGGINGLGNMGPLGWFLSCIFLWVIAFPLYLYKRKAFKSNVQERIEPTLEYNDSIKLQEKTGRKRKSDIFELFGYLLLLAMGLLIFHGVHIMQLSSAKPVSDKYTPEHRPATSHFAPLFREEVALMHTARSTRVGKLEYKKYISNNVSTVPQKVIFRLLEITNQLYNGVAPSSIMNALIKSYSYYLNNGTKPEKAFTMVIAHEIKCYHFKSLRTDSECIEYITKNPLKYYNY